MHLIVKSHEYFWGGGGGRGGKQNLFGGGEHTLLGSMQINPCTYTVQYMTHYYNAMWIPQNLPVFQCICMKYRRMGGSEEKNKILNKLVLFQMAADEKLI